MNLFGNSAVDGSGKLVRHVAMAGAAVILAAVAAAVFLDRAANDGTLASLSFGNAPRGMAGVPRSQEPTGGVRYGNVDYMPTASIPGQKSRLKNVVTDPSLGMPQ